MKNTTNYNAILHQAALIIAILFGICSCGIEQKPEINKKPEDIKYIEKRRNCSPSRALMSVIKKKRITIPSTQTNNVHLNFKKLSNKSGKDLNYGCNDKMTSVKEDFLVMLEKIPTESRKEDSLEYTTVIPPTLFSPLDSSDLIKQNMTPAKLEGGVNSEYPEIGPILSPDGKTLYFSRYRDPGNFAGKEDEEDIWYSEWDSVDNKWGEAKNIGAPLNNKYPNFINSISPDGNTILLGNIYFCNNQMGPGLSMSHRTPKGWSFPNEIIFDSNGKQPKVSGCHISTNQKILILAFKQRKNTYGEQDLYVSFKKQGNNWSKPVNLGAIVNTKGTESAPFLAADNCTLYYTSNGLSGYGGDDIYVTHRLDDTWQNWSEPKNLGPKVNTNTNQSFFSISNGNIYFSSEDTTNGNSDIFTFKYELPKIAVNEQSMRKN